MCSSVLVGDCVFMRACVLLEWPWSSWRGGQDDIDGRREDEEEDSFHHDVRLLSVRPSY